MNLERFVTLGIISVESVLKLARDEENELNVRVRFIEPVLQYAITTVGPQEVLW